MTEIIGRLVNELAVAQRDLKRAQDEKGFLMEGFLESGAMVAASSKVVCEKELHDELRTELQKAIKERFAETGDKQVHPAASIAMRKVYDFDNDEVIVWCIAHDHPKLLRLNMVAVKKMAGISDIPVAVTETPSTRISKDLSGYIVEDTPDA